MELNFHPDDDQLEEYVLGRSPLSASPLLEEHFLICSNCRDRLDNLEQFALGIRQALAVPATPSPSWSGWFDWVRRPAFAMAFAMLALVAVVSTYSIGRTRFAPVASLQLSATRGELPTVAPARELDLTLSDAPPQSGTRRAEVFNGSGKNVWSGIAQDGPGGIEVKAEQRLGPGNYFLRLYSASGEVLREYGFRIRK